MTSIAFCFLFLRFEFLGRAFSAQEKKLFKLYMCIYIKLICIIGTLGDSQLHNSSQHFQTSFLLFYISSIFFCIYFQPPPYWSPSNFSLFPLQISCLWCLPLHCFPTSSPQQGPLFCSQFLQLLQAISSHLTIWSQESQMRGKSAMFVFLGLGYSHNIILSSFIHLTQRFHFSLQVNRRPLQKSHNQSNCRAAETSYSRRDLQRNSFTEG